MCNTAQLVIQVKEHNQGRRSKLCFSCWVIVHCVKGWCSGLDVVLSSLARALGTFHVDVFPMETNIDNQPLFA